MPLPSHPPTPAASSLGSAEIDAALSTALRTLRATTERFGLRYPDDTTHGDRYPLRPALGALPPGSNHGWTTGFWPGQLWLAHSLTGEPDLRDAALAHVPSFAARVSDGIDLDTHDLGFLYTPSCVVAWRETGNEQAREAALGAASHLRSRFLAPAGIIQAWGDLNDPLQRGRTIIDSLLNVPLLLWAAQETGQDELREIAYRHVEALQTSIVRADDTTFHTFYWDTGTGQPLRGSTHQGYADDSCWARGQAWGILGFALNARLQDTPQFLATAIRLAEYFLAHQGADKVATWDLALTGQPDQPWDASASAIAACGLLEIAGQDADVERAARYRREAGEIVAALVARCTAPLETTDALLRHGVYNLNRGAGVDEGNLWGDYFYLEALQRLRDPAWVPHW